MPKMPATLAVDLGNYLDSLLPTFFKNLKLAEVSKNDSNIICTPIKVVLFCKVRRVSLKNWAYHAHFRFEI